MPAARIRQAEPDLREDSRARSACRLLRIRQAEPDLREDSRARSACRLLRIVRRSLTYGKTVGHAPRADC